MRNRCGAAHRRYLQEPKGRRDLHAAAGYESASDCCGRITARRISARDCGTANCGVAFLATVHGRDLDEAAPAGSSAEAFGYRAVSCYCSGGPRLTVHVHKPGGTMLKALWGSRADCPFAGTVGPFPVKAKTLAGRPAPGSVSRGAGWLHGRSIRCEHTALPVLSKRIWHSRAGITALAAAVSCNGRTGRGTGPLEAGAGLCRPSGGGAADLEPFRRLCALTIQTGAACAGADGRGTGEYRNKEAGSFRDFKTPGSAEASAALLLLILLFRGIMHGYRSHF